MAKTETLDANAVNQIKESVKVPLIHGTRWQGVSPYGPYRGITDYHMVLVFERELAEEELKSVCSFLQGYNCPGWTGVQGRQLALAPSTYVFAVTDDSTG